MFRPTTLATSLFLYIALRRQTFSLRLSSLHVTLKISIIEDVPSSHLFVHLITSFVIDCGGKPQG